MRKLIIAFLFLMPATFASAQTRASASVDYSQFSVDAGNYSPKFSFDLVSVKIENQFKNPWIPGFAFGVRKESKDIFSGTYFTLELFHAFDRKHFSIIASGGAIYGLPGLQFDRSDFSYENNGVVAYRNVSMTRNAATPGMEVERAGILQPIFEVKARKYLGHLFFEGHGGVRLANFNTVSSDFKNSTYSRKLVPMPSVGIGIGYSF